MEIVTNGVLSEQIQIKCNSKYALENEIKGGKLNLVLPCSNSPL